MFLDVLSHDVHSALPEVKYHTAGPISRPEIVSEGHRSPQGHQGDLEERLPSNQMSTPNSAIFSTPRSRHVLCVFNKIVPYCSKL